MSIVGVKTIIQRLKSAAIPLVGCSVIIAGFVGRIQSTEQLRLSLEDAVSLALRRNETLLIALEEEKRAGGVVRE